MSLHPVAVMNRSPTCAASSMVVTSNPSIRGSSALTGFTSVMTTRAPIPFAQRATPRPTEPNHPSSGFFTGAENSLDETPSPLVCGYGEVSSIVDEYVWLDVQNAFQVGLMVLVGDSSPCEDLNIRLGQGGSYVVLG